MPIRVTTKPGAEGYIDIRVGGQHTIHQTKLGAAGLAASRNTQNLLMPGLPVKADGTPVTAAAQTAVGVIGPEPVELGSVDVFGNVIFSGGLNRKAIEDNLGRVLTADEVAALPARLFLLA